jgi:integrase/recombinase XerD
VPRTYALDNLPFGPTWADVKRLVASVSGNSPTDIRSRAIILLLAVYGFRQGEVRGLMLEDMDWGGERIHVRRPKQGRRQTYPLAPEVGEAVLRYLQEVRPKSAYRQVFLTVKAPHHPLTSGGLGGMFARQLKRLNVELPHYGPHTLRHACATRLLEQGFSLKEIGDHLGHRSSRSTQVYTKIDLASLRQVADMGLESVTDYPTEMPRLVASGVSGERLVALREVGQIRLGGLL